MFERMGKKYFMIVYPRDFIVKLRSVYGLNNEIMSLVFCDDEESFKKLGSLLKTETCNSNICNIDVINAYRSGNIESLYNTACENVIKKELYNDWIVLYSKHLSDQFCFSGTGLLKKLSNK